jgi:hypothetical protein
MPNFKSINGYRSIRRFVRMAKALLGLVLLALELLKRLLDLLS